MLIGKLQEKHLTLFEETKKEIETNKREVNKKIFEFNEEWNEWEKKKTKKWKPINKYR